MGKAPVKRIGTSRSEAMVLVEEKGGLTSLGGEQVPPQVFKYLRVLGERCSMRVTVELKWRHYNKSILKMVPLATAAVASVI